MVHSNTICFSWKEKAMILSIEDDKVIMKVTSEVFRNNSAASILTRIVLT